MSRKNGLQSAGRALFVVGLLGLGVACQQTKESGSQGVLEPSAEPRQSEANTSKAVGNKSPRKSRKPQKWHIRVGPQLGILPGKGLGPIRFGATVATVERHMQASCGVHRPATVGTQEQCLFPAQAVEFSFSEGVLVAITVHGHGRLVSPGKKTDYGIFNGGFVNGAQMGMLTVGVEEFMGKPLSTAKVPTGHPHGAVEVHTYSGAQLEYKRSRLGRLVLDAVILEKRDL